MYFEGPVVGTMQLETIQAAAAFTYILFLKPRFVQKQHTRTIYLLGPIHLLLIGSSRKFQTDGSYFVNCIFNFWVQVQTINKSPDEPIN